MGRDTTHEKAEQRWLPGLEPELELPRRDPLYEVNSVLARLTPEYHREGLALFRPRDSDKLRTGASNEIKEEFYIKGHFYVGLLADRHPQTCNIHRDKNRIATLHTLAVADPIRVLSQVEDAASEHRETAVFAAIPALSTIALHNSSDEASWKAFNDTLREFMSAVCPTPSDNLSTKDYQRLIAQGFRLPKVINELAENIRSYLLRVDSGDINPFRT